MTPDIKTEETAAGTITDSKYEATTEEEKVVEEEVEEVIPEKPKETATESALVQEKGEPKIEIQGPAEADWQTQVDPEEMKR